LYCPNPECPHRDLTGNAAEYLAGVAVCADCGSELVAEDPMVAPTGEEVEDARLAKVGPLIEPAWSVVARSALEEAGIAFQVRGEGVQDLFAWGRMGTGFNPVTGPPTLWVEEGRLEEAKEILATLEEGGEVVPTEELEEGDD